MPNPEIKSTDYNEIRSWVEKILGTTGVGSQGYGQPLVSSAVSVGEDISAGQWQELKSDILSIKLHQDGTTPSMASVLTGDIIRLGLEHPNSNYMDIVNQAIDARFNIGSGRSMVTTKATQTATGSWNTSAECTLTVTFGSAAEARYFFNSSGKIRFFSTRTGGTDSPQNNAWTNLLASIGTVAFEASGTGIKTFYNLTDEYETFYQQGASSPYGANNFVIEVKSNVADNTLGGATILNFKITWNDAYIDPDTLNPDYPGGSSVHAPGDQADGTLSLSIEEFKATGNLAPSGTFTIISPSFSLSAITLDP